jgi:hypothetical protein
VICGIFADPQSVVSVEAFRIVRIVVEGMRDLENPDEWWIQPIKSNSGVHREIEKLAGFFRFGIALTPQMVAAFPLFFGHCYEDLQSVPMPGPLDIPFDNPDSNGKTNFHYEHPKGLTPLEFYAHFLLDDPAVSDRLCQSILHVLRMLEKKMNEVRKWQDDKTRHAYEEDVIRANLPICDFLRSSQPRELPKLDETGLKETKKALGKVIPSNMVLVGVYFPSNSLTVLVRVFLNGAIAQFAVWWLNLELFVLDPDFGTHSYYVVARSLRIPDSLTQSVLIYDDQLKDLVIDDTGKGRRIIIIENVDELPPPEELNRR